jgi:hypothetical protein
MSGLGEEVMVLEGLGEVNNWPGPGWAYCDRRSSPFALRNMSDFPKLPGMDEGSIKNDKKEGLADLPFAVASGAAGKLRFRPAVGPRGKIRKRQKQEEQAKVGMVRDAAADPNNPKSKRIAKLLSVKNKNLGKLANERMALAKKSAALTRGNASLVKKLDVVIGKKTLKYQQSEGSMTKAQRERERARLQKLSDRRAVAARNSVRYSKLESVAKMMGQNAALQASLSSQASAAVRAGDPKTAQAYAEAIRQIGDKNHELKTVRENQKRLWKIQNKQSSYKRHGRRLLSVNEEVNRLQLKDRSSGLTPAEQGKLTNLEKTSIAIKGQLSKLESNVNHDVKLGPEYQRPVDRREQITDPIGADAAHAYASGDVISKLDDDTFMAPEGADIYPAIERSRTVLNPASFLNQTFLAGLTESPPPGVTGPVYPTLKAITCELNEATNSMIRQSFATLAGLGLDPRSFYPLG